MNITRHQPRPCLGMLAKAASAAGYAGLALAGAAETLAHEAHAVEAADGVTLAVQEWGNPEGPPILFLHGFSQSHLSWRPQVEDPELTERFRMVTFDQRGSGMSDKPRDPEAYAAERQAGDVAAIIEALELEAPVLVASSAGGLIVADYVARYGDEALGGLKFAGAVFLRDPQLYGPATAELPAIASDDLATNVAASIRFAEAFFAEPPEEAVVRETLVAQALTPPEVRQLLLERESGGPESWEAVSVPVLIVHGEADAVIRPGMAEEGARLIEHAELTLLSDIGHFPFIEDPEGFNRALADFVDEASESAQGDR